MSLSWYRITISSLNDEEIIYNGCFKVDNDSNLIKEFYETNDGITNFQDNKLIPANSNYTHTSNPSEFNDNKYIASSSYFTNGGVCFNANLNVYNKITNSITLHYSINEAEEQPELIEFNYNNNNNIISTNDYIYNIVPISDPFFLREDTKVVKEKYIIPIRFKLYKRENRKIVMGKW